MEFLISIFLGISGQCDRIFFNEFEWMKKQIIRIYSNDTLFKKVDELELEYNGHGLSKSK